MISLADIESRQTVTLQKHETYYKPPFGFDLNTPQADQRHPRTCAL